MSKKAAILKRKKKNWSGLPGWKGQQGRVRGSCSTTEGKGSCKGGGAPADHTVSITALI